MDNVRILRYDWYTGLPGYRSAGEYLARQYDHLSDMVVLSHAPKLNNYYLIVTMKETEDGDVKTLEPIQLSGSFWLIPNIYTQLAQEISFQFCCKTGSGDFESHSAEIRGRILPSKDHSGEALDVDPSVMFDPYKKWVEEKAMAAGAIVIDSELSSSSTNPVQNRVVKAAIDGLADDIETVNGRLGDVKADLDTVGNLEFGEIKFTIEGTGYLAWETGNVTSSGTSSHTDYINLSNYTKIRYKRQMNTSYSASAGMAFYDSEKSYMSGISAMLGQPSTGYAPDLYEVDIPDGAIYARFSTYTNTDSYGKFEIYGERPIVVEIGVIKDSIESMPAKIEEINDRIFEEKPISLEVTSIPNVNAKTGYNASNGSSSIQMTSNASYDSYWFITEKDVDIWVGSLSSPYFAIIAGNGEFISTNETSSGFYIYCGNGSTRYRNTDNNLPTEENKLHVSAGSPIAFTVRNGRKESVYGLATEIVVSESFKKEVNESNAKSKYVKYIQGNGADSSVERVEIYIPATTGYIRYDFLHTVKQTINSDVWRVGYAYHVTDSFVMDYAITTSGEWECAVKLSDREDFSGGYAHGDEVMNNIVFILDGSPVDITTFTEMTEFNDLCIIEDSSLFDPADSTTVYAKHGSNHCFTNDGLSIAQSLKFVLAETVVTAYLAMLPIAKTVSNTVVPNNSFIPLSTDSAIRINDTDKVVIYKSDGKARAEFSVPIYEYLSNGDYNFLCVDNGTNEYNKCYFANTLSAVNVQQGKLLKAETVYRFAISE